jgi:tetratricopeptide (TPR) repeat protein
VHAVRDEYAQHTTLDDRQPVTALTKNEGEPQGGDEVWSVREQIQSMNVSRRAIEVWEQALALHRELGDRRSEVAVALRHLGNGYAELGEPRRATEFYEQALATARELGDRRREGTTLHNLSLAHEKLGDLPAAIQAAEASLVICEEIEDPNTASTRARLDRLREQLGQSDSPAVLVDEATP